MWRVGLCSDRHGVLHRDDDVMAPTTVLLKDPCPLGLPEMSTAAHWFLMTGSVPHKLMALPLQEEEEEEMSEDLRSWPFH